MPPISPCIQIISVTPHVKIIFKQKLGYFYQNSSYSSIARTSLQIFLLVLPRFAHSHHLSAYTWVILHWSVYYEDDENDGL